MRVLVVSNMWPTAADPSFGVFVREQVDSVRALGVRVDVHVVDGRAGRLNYLRAVPDLRRRLATGSYDLVHAHYVLTGVVAWLAGARQPCRPLIVTHHGIEVFAGWQAPLARWLTHRADRTLVVSRAMATHLGLDRTAVLPCGVDLDQFRPGSRAVARQALGLSARAIIVAWVGADRPEKRLGLARAAVDHFARTVPDTGPLVRATPDVAPRAGLLPDVELLVVSGRPHEEVPGFLQAADVLLVTSRWEGGPLVVKEALACNVPVVSTAVGDVGELIADLPGCAVVEDTPPALARGLAAAIDHGPVDGRTIVATFAKNRIAERLVALYREVEGTHRSPRVAGQVPEKHDSFRTAGQSPEMLDSQPDRDGNGDSRLRTAH